MGNTTVREFLATLRIVTGLAGSGSLCYNKGEFLNDTNWFPENAELETMSVPEILARMDSEQADKLSAIFRHYTMNDVEKFAFSYYKRIVDLFQYPDVCLMVGWLKDEARKEKCLELIRALVEKPL